MDPNPTDICGGCAGIDTETPLRLHNPPGQPTIAYRAGTYARFKESLLARLSDPALPALRGLLSRAESDFSLALCDALATTLDVLTFHGERIANESPLRTATELRSIHELSRLIGYRPAPGVAASTWLAFTLQDSPADPSQAPGPVVIPAGTRVQSVPGPGEQAQTFETVAPREARVAWNAVPVQTTHPWRPLQGDTSLWLDGIGTGLTAGDVILIVGLERTEQPTSSRFDIRLLTQVMEDRDHQRTRLSWQNGLDGINPSGQPPSVGVRVFVFRQRAGLFGHNAPDRRLIRLREDEPPPPSTKAAAASAGPSGPGKSRFVSAARDVTGAKISAVGLIWADFFISGETLDLDAAYPRLLPGSWIALCSYGDGSDRSGLAAQMDLFRAVGVAFPSRTDFGLSGRITRIQADIPATKLGPRRGGLQQSLVLGQSEQLEVSGTPLHTPLHGDTLVLAHRLEDIEAGRVIALRGKAARVLLRPGAAAVLITAAGDKLPLQEGDALRLMGPPEQMLGTIGQQLEPSRFGALLASPGSSLLRLEVLDRAGRQGRLLVAAARIEAMPAEKDDPVLQEISVVASVLPVDPLEPDHSAFRLQKPLRHVYDRDTTTVNLNVAPATHGETVSELLGSGDARRPHARHRLRQGPLTFVTAAGSASGRRSTLELRINDLLWQEVPSLLDRGGGERVYALTTDDQGRTSVHFGDGSEGALPPSGDHNLRAIYRKGLGLGGNVPAGSLTTLLTRPLGVTAVTNPEAASGGEDPEPFAKARTNAPLTVRTLDRAASLRDYRDIARGFPGIAKAHALWIPHGPARGVFLTVAAEEGKAVLSTSDLLANLRTFGDAQLPLRLRSFDPTAGAIRLRLQVKVMADADPTLVMPALARRLLDALGFEARDFGQGVSADEIAALTLAVPGVEACNILALHRVTDPPEPPGRITRLRPRLPQAQAITLPAPAELLRLEAGNLVLEPLP